MTKLPCHAAAVLILTLATTGQAATIRYDDFSSVAGLTLNGAAAQVGNVLRVTPSLRNESGSAFSTSPVSLASNASFSTYFQFRITSAGNGGADGIVFAVQTVANDVGGAGGAIGYGGIQDSVGIEFDTWNNTIDGVADGNSDNHVGIDVNGDINSIALAVVSEGPLDGGDVWNAWVDYDGSTNRLEVRLGRSSARPAQPILGVTRDLAADLGTTSAFVGFTSGTGFGFANHDVLRWQFENRFAPIPEPASGALLALGLAGLGGFRRRRR